MHSTVLIAAKKTFQWRENNGFNQIRYASENKTHSPQTHRPGSKYLDLLTAVAIEAYQFAPFSFLIVSDETFWSKALIEQNRIGRWRYVWGNFLVSLYISTQHWLFEKSGHFIVFTKSNSKSGQWVQFFDFLIYSEIPKKTYKASY